MQYKQIKTYLFWVLLAVGVGALSGFLTRDHVATYALLQKPPLSPPAMVFPIVWTVLFVLMGIAAARIALSQGAGKEPALRSYLLQLAVNFFWSIFFFRLQAYGFSFFWLLLLWVLILRTILRFRPIDRLAGVLLLPYLLWVSFAGYLNLAIWLLNR